MNIVLGDQYVDSISDKNTVLELDTFRLAGQTDTVTAWCVLENTPLSDLMQLENLCDLHRNLMKNYRLRNWNYCEQALEHLMGHWNGELDSFYVAMTDRVRELAQQSLPDDWDGVILRAT